LADGEDWRRHRSEESVETMAGSIKEDREMKLSQEISNADLLYCIEIP